MSRANLKQLRAGDPQIRLQAIKAVAKAKDRNALKQLAIMCEDDPDPQVRNLALKAGVYIRQQLGDLPSPTETDSDESPVLVVVVTEEAQVRAHRMIDTAVSLQINQDTARAMQALYQALKVNPNLEHDEYYRSVAESVTGKSGDHAIENIKDDNERDGSIRERTTQKRQKEIDEHLSEVQKINWQDSAFDLGLLGLIVALGLLATMLIVTQIANNYVNNVEANWQAIDDAIFAGRVEYNDAGDAIYIDEEGKKFTESVPDEAFLNTARQLQQISFISLIPVSVGIGLLTVLLVSVLVALAHGISNMVEGHGSFTYVLHRVASFLTARSIPLFIIIVVGALITFEFGGGVILAVAAGIVGLFSLIVVFNIASKVGESYSMGMAKGLLATLPGLLIAGGTVGLIVVLM